MTKNCPNCGKELPENAKFCMDCGYSIEKANSRNSNIFSNGTIFIILIAAILVIGGIFILTSSFGGNNAHDVTNDGEHVDLTITGVDGSQDDEDKKSYFIYTTALFNSVPEDLNGYNIKTTYYDTNDTEIGHDTETLEMVYYESDYDIGFGYYTSYKLPDLDHVKVEIIKNGDVIDSYTEKIDRNKIAFLN